MELYTQMKTSIPIVLILTLFFVSCSSTKSASYYTTQKNIEYGNLDFSNLRVDEYINAFPQKHLAGPSGTSDLALSVELFNGNPKKTQNANLVQVAIKTRKVTEQEKKKSFGICFVLDVSGSMTNDNKFHDSVDALKKAVLELDEGTEYTLITFSSSASIAVEPTTITKNNRETIAAQIEKIGVGGGTDIEEGLVLGYKTMSQFKSKLTRLILITDGQSSVDHTSPREIATKAQVKEIEDIHISTIGIGRGVEEKVLRKIADEGHGAFYFANNASTLYKFLSEDLKSVMIPVARNAVLSFKPNVGFKIKTVYGYENNIDSQGNVEIKFGDLNVDDWRIVVAEVEKTGATNKASPLRATVDFVSTANNRTIKLDSEFNPKQNKGALNKSVAVNSVIFADALTLIEVSKLMNDHKVMEADEIVSAQLTNVRIAKTFDDTDSLQKEEKTLLDVKNALYLQKGGMPPAHPTWPYPYTSGKNDSAKNLLRDASGLAKKLLPGPWALILSLFEEVL